MPWRESCAWSGDFFAGSGFFGNLLNLMYMEKTTVHKIAHKMELLAPAGSIEAFAAAVAAGADAVYLGAPAFNARALARQFSLAELAAMIAHARKNRVRVYLAMNSLMKEGEIAKAVEMLAAIEALGADAIIVQDLGIFHLARTHFPGLRLHASTLMGAHNSLNVRQLAELGFSRVVLSRELTIAEIAEIHRQCPVELEVFVHGALCFAYSGLCLFSSYLGGKSGLRGRCVQPCRRRYSWAGKERGQPGQAGYLFSLNDLEAIDLLPRLGEAGVGSLKIEGRMRSVQYVAAVVRAYRLALDHPGDKVALAEAKNLLAQAMGRKASSGYFLKAQPPGITAPYHSGNIGLFLGKLEKAGAARAWLTLKEPLSIGDRLRLHQEGSGERQSITLKELWQGNQAVERAGAGSRVQLALPSGAKRGDCLYKVDREERRRQGEAREIRPELFAGKVARLFDRGRMAKIIRSLALPKSSPGHELTRNRSLPGDAVAHSRKASCLSPRCLLSRPFMDGTTQPIPRQHHPAGNYSGPKRTETVSLSHGRRGGGKPPALPFVWWLKSDDLACLKMPWPAKPERLVLTLSRELYARLGKEGKLLAPHRLRLIWALPPVILEADLDFFREAIRALRAAGYHAWMLGHLGQRLFFAEEGESGEGGDRPVRSGKGSAKPARPAKLELFGDYTLNVLNSRSVELLAGLGFAGLQLAIESDRANLFAVLAASKSFPLSLTVYGLPPLFTARLASPFFRYDQPLLSPKGETIILKQRFGQTIAVAGQPFSLIPHGAELAAHGLAWGVIDLSRLPQRPEELTAALALPGRKRRLSSFNYLGELP